MQYVMFIYNVLLIVLFAMCIACYTVYYLREKRVVYLWVAAMFLLFIGENLILYMADFLQPFATFYNMHTLGTPILKTVLSVGITLCYLFIAAFFVDVKPDSLSWAAFVLYIAALVAVPLLPTGRFTYWLYFTLSQMMFFFIGFRCLAGARKLPHSPPEKAAEGKTLRRLLVVALVLNALIVAEDVVVIFFFDELNPEALRITQRNFSEDVQSVLFGIAALYYFFHSFFAAPAKSAALAHYATVSAALRAQKTALMCKQYKLTARESEILELLVQSKSNQEISDALFISTGTVKNHIHNIYQKTGVAGRSGVMQLLEQAELQDN